MEASGGKGGRGGSGGGSERHEAQRRARAGSRWGVGLLQGIHESSSPQWTAIRIAIVGYPFFLWARHRSLYEPHV
jgi:hypothetical protein